MDGLNAEILIKDTKPACRSLMVNATSRESNL